MDDDPPEPVTYAQAGVDSFEGREQAEPRLSTYPQDIRLLGFIYRKRKVFYMAEFITLSPHELAVVKLVAFMRDQNKKNAGFKTETVLDFENPERMAEISRFTNTVGLEGEFVFAKWANLYPDLYVGTDIADTYDFMAYGKRVDVKCNVPRRKDRYLVVEHTKGLGECDVFVNVINHGAGSYEVDGFVPAEELMTESNYGDWYKTGGKHPCWRMHSKDLYRIDWWTKGKGALDHE